MQQNNIFFSHVINWTFFTRYKYMNRRMSDNEDIEKSQLEMSQEDMDMFDVNLFYFFEKAFLTLSKVNKVLSPTQGAVKTIYS